MFSFFFFFFNLFLLIAYFFGTICDQYHYRRHHTQLQPSTNYFRPIRSKNMNESLDRFNSRRTYRIQWLLVCYVSLTFESVNVWLDVICTRNDMFKHIFKDMFDDMTICCPQPDMISCSVEDPSSDKTWNSYNRRFRTTVYNWKTKTVKFDKFVRGITCGRIRFFKNVFRCPNRSINYLRIL